MLQRIQSWKTGIKKTRIFLNHFISFISGTMPERFRSWSLFHNETMATLVPMEGGQWACWPREEKEKWKEVKSPKLDPSSQEVLRDSERRYRLYSTFSSSFTHFFQGWTSAAVKGRGDLETIKYAWEGLRTLRWEVQHQVKCGPAGELQPSV